MIGRSRIVTSGSRSLWLAPGEPTNALDAMSADSFLFRRLAASLLAVLILSAVPAAADETVVLRVGDQKGGNRSLLDISGYGKDLPYRIEWSEFPAAAPILEALNAGALDVGYTGDLSFLTVYAAGAPIKAIGGAKAEARTQAILVRKDSPIRSAADLKGRGWPGPGRLGSVPHQRDLEKAQIKREDATFAALGPVDAKVALVTGAVDAWAIWEPYVSFATLKDGARVGRHRRRPHADHHVHHRVGQGDRRQAGGGAGLRRSPQQGETLVPRPSRRIRQVHGRADQAARGRAARRLHRAAQPADRHRRGRGEGGAGGLGPRDALRDPAAPARRRPGGRPELHRHPPRTEARPFRGERHPDGTDAEGCARSRRSRPQPHAAQAVPTPSRPPRCRRRTAR